MSYGYPSLPNTSVLTPTGGPAAGTSPTITITGNSHTGLISLTTGTSPSAGAVLMTGTFATPYVNAPSIVLTAANANAAGVPAVAIITGLISRNIWASTTPTTFQIMLTGTVALAASTAYLWNYEIVGRT